MRVLLIEDDPMIGQGVRQALEDAQMVVDWTRNGLDGEEALRDAGYAMVLLDLGLPEKSGIELLRTLRRRENRAPVLIISAREDLDRRIEALDLGADDFLVKPFDVRELLARMRAVLRRRHGGQAVLAIVAGALELDLASHVLRWRDVAQSLSPREFSLMQALIERSGAILSRGQLEERLYGWGEEVESNAVEVLIHGVRKKFGKDVIRNVRGAGWMVAKESS